MNGAAYGREKRIEVADAYMLGMDQQVLLETKYDNQPRRGERDKSVEAPGRRRGSRFERRRPIDNQSRHLGRGS